MENKDLKKEGNKATFTIQIQFQQHSTWQGTIGWVEGGKKQKFRSELEMLKLMMEAMNSSNEGDSKKTDITWD